MAVGVSLRGLANTVLFVVGAFVIGDVLHRSLVTGEIELLAAESVARIALGAVILGVAYLVGVPREAQGEAWERGGGESEGGDDGGEGEDDGGEGEDDGGEGGDDGGEGGDDGGEGEDDDGEGDDESEGDAGAEETEA